MDQRAVGHALLAPERGIERDRIALEGEAVFHGEVDLIDVAGGDVVRDLGEGAVIALARPGELEVGDLGALGGAVRLKPGARAFIVERTRIVEQADPQQRYASVVRQQTSEFRLEAIAELVGEEARGMESARQPRRDPVESRINLARRVSGDDQLRFGIEQASAARRQAVVEQDIRSSCHLITDRTTPAW